MRAFVLPPLPSADADAAANDRFDLRLTRARLAVVHRAAPSQSPSTTRNVAAPSVAVIRTAFENIR